MKTGFKDKNGKEICLSDYVQCVLLEEKIFSEGFNEHGARLCYPAKGDYVGKEMFSKKVMQNQITAKVKYDNIENNFYILDTKGIAEIKYLLKDVVEYCAVIEIESKESKSLCYQGVDGKIRAFYQICKNEEIIKQIELGCYNNIDEAMKVCESKIKTIDINL